MTSESRPIFAARARAFLCFSAVAALAFAASGCSISRSISDSISSPFEWSSDSSDSSSHDHDDAYLNDLRDYTDVYVRSSTDPEGLKRGVSVIAQKHGVTNWEADSATFRGIGEGLGKADVSQKEVDSFKMALADNRPIESAAIQRGYDAER